MARIRRHSRAIAAGLLGLALAFAPALAQDQGLNAGTDLYDRPVLAIDPGAHTAKIQAQAVDSVGRYAVTGGDDRTVRIWSVADGKLVRTIWIPVGPENVGAVYAVAISPDGSTIAAGGFTENRNGPCPIYLFDRESGNLVRRIHDDLPDVTFFLTFSPDGRYLAATLGSTGLRIFDRDKDWSEAFRDDQYGDRSEGAVFTRDGRLAVTALDGLIRLYKYEPANDSPNFRRFGEPVKAPLENRPRGIAFSPDGKLLAVGYIDSSTVDILDGKTLNRLGGHKPSDIEARIGLERINWSRDGETLFAVGAVFGTQGQTLLFAWDGGGLGLERRITYCDTLSSASGVDALPDGRILVASMKPCLGLLKDRGKPSWTVAGSRLSRRHIAGFAGRPDRRLQLFRIGGARAEIRPELIGFIKPAVERRSNVRTERRRLVDRRLGEWNEPSAERPGASLRTLRPCAKPRDRSGRQAFLPRLGFRPDRSTTQERKNGDGKVVARSGRST
jgi:hypothetical protein